MWGAVQSHQQWLGDRVLHTNTLKRYAALLALVEGAAFDNAVVAGRSLTLDVAVQEAVETYGPWAVTPPPDAGSH